jgi:hypothetical protein
MGGCEHQPLTVRSRPEPFHRRPQQDPGPAQPSACPGWLPQQAVSWGPGSDWALRPVRLLVADISLVVFELPQEGQIIGTVRSMIRTSPV